LREAFFLPVFCKSLIMNFLYPQFLWALLLISIPVIIHLFRFRKFKKIQFSNTAFLASVVVEKQNKNKIKNLILLFIRIITIILLVLAFSQPFIPSSEQSKGKKLITIYIDNSPSMENINKDGLLIDAARNVAKKIIKGHGKNDKFIVITNSFKYKEQQFYTYEDALQMVDEVQISPLNRSLQSIYDKTTQLASEYYQLPNSLYLISDFQKANGNPEQLPVSAKTKFFMLPLRPSSFNNLSIDSCWFSSPFVYPLKMITLFVNIKNYGNLSQQNNTLELNIDGKNKIISFDINENELKTIEIPLIIDRSGWLKCSLSLTDYPVIFDDIYYFSFNIRKSIEILSVNENQSNQFVNTAFATDPYFRIQSMLINKLDDNSLKNFNLIVLNELSKIPTSLNQALFDFCRQGGSILLVPPTNEKLDYNSYTNFCKTFGITSYEQKLSNATKIQSFKVQHPFFQGVFEKKHEKFDFPSLKKAYSRATSSMSTEYHLMSFENNEPFLTIAGVGKGNIFTLSVPFNQEWSNLVYHPIFVPLLYQMALYQSQSIPLAYTLGKDKVFELPLPKDETSEIRITNSRQEFIPKTSYFGGSLVFQIDDNFKDAGFYKVKTDNDFQLAFNNNRTESQLETYSVDELKIIQKNNSHIQLINALHPNLAQKIQEQNEGKVLWQVLIWIALAFLLSEVLITRFFRKI